MIELKGLTKRYGELTVLDDVSLTVADGEAVALWGPNGAGKTTIVRSILGLISYEGTVAGDEMKLDVTGTTGNQMTLVARQQT